jgi:hypothetical protein
MKAIKLYTAVTKTDGTRADASEILIVGTDIDADRAAELVADLAAVEAVEVGEVVEDAADAPAKAKAKS